MAQVETDNISPIEIEPPQNPPEPAISQPPSTPAADPEERWSSNVSNTLRSTEEGISVKSKFLCVHKDRIMEAYVASPRSPKEDMCQSSQSRARALRVHLRLKIFFDGLHFGVPGT